MCLHLPASIIIYYGIRNALKDVFLTYSEFKSPMFEKWTAFVWLLGLMFGVVMRQFNVIYAMHYLSILFLSQTTVLMALSREKSGLRKGDFEALSLATILILLGGIVFYVLGYKDYIELANVFQSHAIYSASIFVLLTSLRR